MKSKYIKLSFAIPLACLFAWFVIPVLADAGFTITAVDNSGNGIEGLSMALNGNGFPVISYRDITSLDLKLAVCSDAACTDRILTTVDSDGDVGMFNSLALNRNGYPVISYWDYAPNFDLKVAVCGDVTCTTKTITTVASKGDVGQSSSLTLNSKGFPVISYWDYTNGNLKVAVCGNATCSTKTITTVDSSEAGAQNIGSRTSLVLNGDDFPAILYDDFYNGNHLKLALCGNVTCTAKKIVIVDENGALGSLALNNNGLPVISYYGASTSDLNLKLAVCDDAACTTKTITTVDSAGNVGWDTSLALNKSGYPVISYLDNTNRDLKLAVCGNVTCTAKTINTVDSAGWVGFYTSLKLDSGDHSFIGYYDATNGQLKLALSDPPPAINQTVGQADPTANATSINFTVIFSNPIDVSSFIGTDVTLGGTAGAMTAAVTEIAPNDGTTFNIAVGGVTNDGTVTASIAAAQVQYLDGGYNIASISADNNVTYDSTGPTVTLDQAVGQADPPLNATQINFIAVFSEPINKLTFTSNDVTLGGTAGATTAIITEVAPKNGTTFNIAVGGMTNNGTVTASIAATQVQDLAGNDNVASTSSDDSVTYDAPPTVVITLASSNPSNASYVDFTVTFSEPVTGVDVSDFKLTNSLLTDVSITNVSGSGAVYTVTVNTGTGNGTIRLDVPATASVHDSAGNLLNPYLGGETYTVSKGIAPTIPNLKSPANNALVPTLTPTLDWNNSSEVLGLAVPGWHYEINITSPSGYNETFNTVDNADPLVGLGESTYIFVSALPANTTFTWKVRAYNDNNQHSAWSASRSFRTKLNPPALTFPADKVTLDNIRPTFNWGVVSGATSYTLQILNGTLVVHTGTVKAPAFVYIPTIDLLPGTPYIWKVKSNGMNAGDYSAPFTFTTSSNPPKPPILLAPANNALVDSAVPQNLEWNPASPVDSPAAASYEVEYAMTSSFTGVSDTFVVINAPTTKTDRISFPPGRIYWRVRSWSGADATGNHSTWSVARTFRSPLPAPSLVSPDFTVTVPFPVELDNKRPTLEWSAVTGAVSYTVEVSISPFFTTRVITATVMAPKLTYTHTAYLLAGTVYYWRVRANAAIGGREPGVYSMVWQFKTANPPTIPALISPPNNKLVASLTPTLDWGAAVLPPVTLLNSKTSFDHYDLQVDTSADFPNDTYVNIYDITEHEYTFYEGALLPNTTYYWRVRATNTPDAGGTLFWFWSSGWSEVRTFRTAYGGPTLLTPINDASWVEPKPTFTWDPIVGATSYSLQVSKSNTFSTLVINKTVTASTYTHTVNLDADSTYYYWRVRANGPDYGPGYWSTVFGFIIP